MRDVNPKLNAVVVDLSEEALRASKAADNARAKQRELGPLHGVPITIKENVDYEGRPNPNGVAAQMKIWLARCGGSNREASGNTGAQIVGEDGLSGSRPSFARLIDKGVTSWDLSVERLSRHSSAVALGSATFGHR